MKETVANQSERDNIIMSFYVSSPYKASPILLTLGKPEYVFGSFRDNTGPTTGFIISDASNGTTTGTLIFQITGGNTPSVGALITVVGASNSPNFNVTNAQILTVAVTEQGVCTVTYAITSTATPTVQTQDFGSVIIPQVEVGDAFTTAGGASVPVAAPSSPAHQSGKSITATATFPSQQLGVSSTLSATTVVIQGSNQDLNGSYQTIGTLTAAGAAGNVYSWQSGEGNTGTGTEAAGSVNLLGFRFYRLNVTGATGAGPIAGTIMIE